MSTENGWTKVFPQVEGLYFARRTQTNVPGLTIIQVWQYEDEWFAYRFARNEDIEAQDFTRSLYEYAGPLRPEDFEQLAALRKAATLLAIPYEALLADWPSRRWIAPEIWRAIEDGVAALREALGDK